MRTPALPCLIAAMLLALPALGADEPKVDPAGKALLEEVIRTYRELPAYADHGRFTIKAQVAGQPVSIERKASIALERPNRFLLDVEEARAVCDGKAIHVLTEPTHAYLVLPAPETVNANALTHGPVGSLVLGGPPGVSIIADLLAGSDLEKSLREGTLSLAVEPDREADGKTLKLLKVTPDAGPALRLVIDPATKLIERIELPTSNEPFPGLEESFQLPDDAMVWNAGAISTEPPDEKTFAFEAPAGFQQVVALEDPEAARAADGKKAHPLVGKPAPEFTLNVLAGPDRTQTLNKGELAGKVVMLDFWATWCGPCLEELPEVARMIEEYEKGGKAVVIIAVSQDRAPEDGSPVRTLVEKLLDSKKLALASASIGKVALDPDQAVGDAFGVQALPTVVLLDPEGVIQAVHVGNRDDVRDILTTDINLLLEGKSLAEPEPAPEARPLPR